VAPRIRRTVGRGVPVTNIVYVSNADSGDLSVLSLDEDAGTLSPLQRVEVTGNVMPLALRPDTRVLYAARRSEPMAAAAFEVDAKSGLLSSLGEAPLPASMAYLSTDRSGRWLFSASYGGNLIAVNPLAADGRPQGSSLQIPTGPKAHCIRTTPDNRHLFAVSLGAGQVLQFRFDERRGELVPNDPPVLPLRPEAGPRHLVFHPTAPWVLLLNELDASVDVLAFDAARGTLSHHSTVHGLPPGFSGEPWASEIRLSPDGRFLYTSERRGSTIATFAFDAGDASLRLLGHTPVQAQPRGFALSPSGRHLVVAGQASHKLGLHARDTSTGALTLLGEYPAGRNPNWVEILEFA
jgi:6-phosphogluconolactonase